MGQVMGDCEQEQSAKQKRADLEWYKDKTRRDHLKIERMENENSLLYSLAQARKQTIEVMQELEKINAQKQQWMRDYELVNKERYELKEQLKTNKGENDGTRNT